MNRSLLALLLLGGCQAELVGDATNPDLGGAPAADLRMAPPPDLAPPAAVDDSAIVAATLPGDLVSGQAFAAQVTVRNTGSTTWTRAGGYKLGAVGDADPFHPSEPRVWLPDGAGVAPGAEYTFDVPMTAPDQGGAYVTKWQMVREAVHWFGGVASANVHVTALPYDLAGVTIYNSPDVSQWPATAKITTLDLQANGVYVDFTRRDGDGSWPDVPFGAPGDSLEYTLWIVLRIDGNWYASGCIEYWRGLDRNGGPPSGYAMNWYYDPIRWKNMVGHQPAVGEIVGFLVSAGDARNDGNSIVQERSNVVFVPFPSDAGAVFHY